MDADETMQLLLQAVLDGDLDGLKKHNETLAEQMPHGEEMDGLLAAQSRMED